LKRTSTAIGFWFFKILILNIWKDFKILSHLIQKSSQSSYIFVRRFLWAQTVTFFAKPGSKNAGESTIVLWKTARSSLNESVPANRKKGFFTNHVPKKQEDEGIFYEAAQNFEVFSYVRDQNLKNKKKTF
jgi:hypothetical protein